MKIFLDSVDLNEIKKYSAFNLIDGVTTNPSLMASSKLDFYSTINSIVQIVSGDVSIEVISTDYEQMLKEGDKITKSGESNIVIKLPMTWDGIRACRYFTYNGHKVNMTLCFTSSQALLAAKAGATYISPFIGRLEDNGQSGIALIQEIRKIYDNYGFKTQILAASIRNITHVEQCAVAKADVVTVPAKVMSHLVEHELTKSGLEKFNLDWSKSDKNI